METHSNNDIERMKIIKIAIFIFTINIVALIIAIIMMTIGIIQFDVSKYASSVTVVYIVVLISWITQWIPLWSIYQMLKDMKKQKE
ncbi:MAG: hypothetical protein NC489_42755 [Ruminococcus flavefaciens]|nr:hypothetical protein [Ruminococcus flavefaciens]